MRIGVGLSIPELATRGGKFSPASLFSGGVQGAWYAPDDFSTLFQDSAGTTPVTAVEQPVGLMLDKSQGLVLGDNVVTNGGFDTDTNWIKGVGWTITGGEAVATASNSRIDQDKGINFFNSSVLYQCTIKIKSISGVLLLRVGSRSVGGVQFTSAGTYTFYMYPVAGDELRWITVVTSGTTTAVVDDVIVKPLPGNHASQATAASRPVLRARYNLLTYSEQFDNTATWTSLSGTGSLVIAANTTETTDPVGGNTADKFTAGSTPSTAHGVYASFTYLATAYTFSVYAKAGTYSFFALDFANGGSQGAVFNLSNGTVGFSDTGVTASISAAGNGWYRCVITKTMAAGGSFPEFYFTSSGTANTRIYTAAGTETAYFWGVDLRTGTSAGTYQRIAAATDYATAGFLPYLYFVTDDSFSTSAINLSGTDKVSVITGYTKLSDSAVGMLYELGIDPTTTNGTFNFVAPQSTVDGSYRINVRGTTTVQVNTAARAAPVTDVSSLQANIAGPSISLRLNGAVAASSTSSMGTGNFANSALYIGRRNNSNFPINGNFYQMVICGKALSASELASTEAYVATKTGVTL